MLSDTVSGKIKLNREDLSPRANGTLWPKNEILKVSCLYEGANGGSVYASAITRKFFSDGNPLYRSVVTKVDGGVISQVVKTVCAEELIC